MESFIGYIAAFCTTAAFFPQAMKVYRTRQTRDISLWMFLLMTTGLIAWLIYGLLINSLPIILANIVTLIFAVYILIMKIILESNKSQEKYETRY
jgi:MtN3 and saliva related transmembrane protein